ncbi:cobalt ECF transporter T component CbiQ [Clostridium carnis]
MIREINLYSLNSKYREIHPLEKIFLVIVSLVSCSYTKNIYFICFNILLIIVLNLLAKNPLKIVSKFLAIISLFSLFTAITLLIDRYTINYILILILRGINGGVSIGFLALTTPINHIVYILSKWEYTKDIGDIIKSMERFIIILEDDFSITLKAIKSRAGFNGFKGSVIDFGKLCGVSFKNLINRWKEIDLALKNRCYIGRHNYSYNFNKNNKIIIGIIIYTTITIILI